MDLISREWITQAMEHCPWDTEKDRNRAIHYVRDIAPSAETTGALDEAIHKYVEEGLMELPPSAEIQENRMFADGTLSVKVDDYYKVKRVLIHDDKKWGGLFYPDQDESDRSKDCGGCKFLGCYEADFPCATCERKTKDYYCPEKDIEGEQHEQND